MTKYTTLDQHVKWKGQRIPPYTVVTVTQKDRKVWDHLVRVKAAKKVTKEAPVEDAPAEEAPVEEAPAEEAPAEEAPAEEAPAEDAPADSRSES